MQKVKKKRKVFTAIDWYGEWFFSYSLGRRWSHYGIRPGGIVCVEKSIGWKKVLEKILSYGVKLVNFAMEVVDGPQIADGIVSVETLNHQDVREAFRNAFLSLRNRRRRCKA